SGKGEAMSAHIDSTQWEHPPVGRDLEGDRYEAVSQYSLAQILAVWAAAAVPMGVLAWIVAPWLRDQLGGDEPLAQSLLILLTAGLVWQFVLVLILVRRELGGLQWSRVRDALWLRPPRDPKTGRVGGKVWWWALLFFLLFAIWGLVPAIPGPSVRDFSDFLGSDRGEDFFSGAWGWFAVVVALAVFNTVLGEELLFRGLLLPRMRGVFGKRDWIANGALFALYHLHMPWRIPFTFIDGIFLLAYPHNGSRARGWGSSCTRVRASSSSASSLPSCFRSADCRLRREQVSPSGFGMRLQRTSSIRHRHAALSSAAASVLPMRVTSRVVLGH
ncbi:MAG TPA: type II CAAX endopeptidase family protein, partial [Myxococcaceae bacterium]|nr:type II CAAX endopeptidase family protein [Myxococcaceae bacterium]